MVDHREAGHVPLVGLQEGDAAAVGAPPVGLVVASAVDLLLVDPIEPAVQGVLAAVGGQLHLFAREVDNVQVRVAHEGDAAAVGREAGQFLVLGSVGETCQRLAGEIPREQIRGKLEQEPVRIRREAQGSGPRFRSGVLMVQPEFVFQGLRQRLGVIERLGVSGHRVDERPARAVAVLVVRCPQIVPAAGQPPDSRQVWREVEGVRPVDVVKLQGLLLRRCRLEREEGEENERAEAPRPGDLEHGRTVAEPVPAPRPVYSLAAAR